jgi:hypothetical protein
MAIVAAAGAAKTKEAVSTDSLFIIFILLDHSKPIFLKLDFATASLPYAF